MAETATGKSATPKVEQVQGRRKEVVGEVVANPAVLRVKGFSAIAGKPMRLLIQAVGSRVAQHYDRAWGPGEARQGNLVVIGLKGLDRAAITRALIE